MAEEEIIVGRHSKGLDLFTYVPVDQALADFGLLEEDFLTLIKIEDSKVGQKAMERLRKQTEEFNKINQKLYEKKQYADLDYQRFLETAYRKKS